MRRYYDSVTNEKQWPDIFQVSGAQVLLRSQHLASKVYVFPRQWVDLATKWFGYEASLYLGFVHHWQFYIWHPQAIWPLYAGATLAHSSDLQPHTGTRKALLLLPRETLQAQGKLNTYFKKLKKFLQFQRILDKALNAGSSRMTTQQGHTNKQELLPFQGHCWSSAKEVQIHSTTKEVLSTWQQQVLYAELPCWKHSVLLSSGRLLTESRQLSA